MKKTSFFFVLSLFLGTSSIAQNVGVGTITPRAKLEVNSSTANPAIFNGVSPMFMSIYEDNIYRGYWGSYSGDAADVDFGTGAGSTGKVHLTTSATPRLSIDNIGNVGVGTTTPNYRMHVTGGDLFVNSAQGSIRYGYEGSNQWKLSTIGGGSNLLWITSTDGSNSFYRHIFDNLGNVGFGIGNVAPIASLDIKSNGISSTTNAFMLRNSINDTLIRVRDNGYMGIGYNGPSYGRPLNIQGSGMNFYYNQPTYGGSIFPNSDGSLNMWAPSSSINLQPTTGAVTIGTYTPAVGYLLSVDGKAIFEEARVQLSTSWPDYVFAHDYKLLSLTDLEQSIARNKHLPNMPPASEVEKNGFDLGDMNKRLVEKVEELTLYIIQLDKEKSALETRMTKMEKLIADKK